jgi:integrase
MALRNDTSRDFLLILIFTGLRHDEAAGLLWENVNFPGKTITVTDTKNNTDFVQPMSKFVYDLLRRRAKKKVSKIFVFPSNKSTSGRLESVYGAVKNVASMASVDWEPHDLRRSFATYAGLFVSESMVNRLINHVDKRSVTQAHYMRIKVEQMREPIEKVAQHLLQHSGDAFEQSSPLGSASELPQKQEKHQEDTIKLAK